MKTLTSPALVSRFRGEQDALLWYNFNLTHRNEVIASGRELMACVPPALGYCALLSATWATILRKKYSIPAIAVVGDLAVDGYRVFSAHEPGV